jgi:4-amino-4-deoxy-L-arabinose transferase-like glycosyltransferase
VSRANQDRLLPALLFALALVLASLFAAPASEAYAYVQHIARTGRPPVLEARCYDEAYKNALVGSNFVQEPDFSRFCYEGHQPPLFYYLAAPVFLLTGGSLLALRLFCALLGAGVAPVAYLTTRAAGGDSRLALATGGFVALLPQHLAMIGSLNNDALTYVLVVLAVFQMVLLLNATQERERRGWLRLALLVGLCLVTKTLAWVVVPLAALTLLLTRETVAARGLLLRRAVLLLLVPALFILPWFARNAATYEGPDLMALQRHDEIAIGQPRTAQEVEIRGVSGTLLNGLRTTFRSFWGQFGWMKAPLQAGEYVILSLFALGSAVGLIGWLARRGWRSWGIDGRALLLFAAWVLINASLLVYYNLEFVQYQGRYLFPSLTAIALLFMVGLGAWLPSRAPSLPWLALLAFLLYLDLLAILERLPGMMYY